MLDLSATDAKNAGARGVLNFVEKRLEPTDILSFEFPVNGKIPDIALKSGDLFEVKSLVWSKYDDFLLRREFADTVAQVRPMVEALQGTSAKVTLAYRFPMTAQVRSVFAEVFGDLAGQIQLIDGF